MKLSVIIPCYNESGNIPRLVERVTTTIERRTDIEVIFVDNGSNDQSHLTFEGLLADHPHMRCVRVVHNQGYGHGILYGLAQANDADLLAWTHADMQTDPADILKALDRYVAAAESDPVVKGKRAKRPFLDTAFSKGMQIFATLVLRVGFDDVNAQPKLFSRKFYEAHVKDQAPLDFSLDLFLLHRAATHKHPILTVPVVFEQRLFGEAKGGGSWKTRIKLISRTIRYIFELRQSLKNEL